MRENGIAFAFSVLAVIVGVVIVTVGVIPVLRRVPVIAQFIG